MKAIFLSFAFICFRLFAENSRMGWAAAWSPLLTLARLAFSGGWTSEGRAHAVTTASHAPCAHLGAACAGHRVAVRARRRDGVAPPRGRLCRRAHARRRPHARGAGRRLTHGD